MCAGLRSPPPSRLTIVDEGTWSIGGIGLLFRLAIILQVLMWVDAPVINIKRPGAGHSPVIDVLHRIKDFHSQAILGGGDGVEFTIVVQTSNGTHHSSSSRAKHFN